MPHDVERVSAGAASESDDAPRGHTTLSPDQLSSEALQALCEEFVTRDGTDYGRVEMSVEEKVRRLRTLLDRGEATIVFDFETESATIVATREL